MIQTGQKERIQKVLAAAGYGSRRACEDLVREGRVQVNGQVRSELPILVDPAVDAIRVSGSRVRRARLEYFILHKPRGVLCTHSDPAGRPRAIDLLQGVRTRVFPVGRLDEDSTGLLLMTNDGELAERLTHPRYGIRKTYEAVVQGRLTPAEIEQLQRGVWLAEGKARTAGLKLLHNGRERSVIEITLQEGRNRQVRRMLARVGHKVLALKRTRLGNLRLRGLGPGRFRALTWTEQQHLHKLAAFVHEQPRPAPPARVGRKSGTRHRRRSGPSSRSPKTA